MPNLANAERVNLAIDQVVGHLGESLRLANVARAARLPRSGYVPDDQPGFEAWIGRPFAHGTGYFELYAQVPIKR